LLNKEKFDQRSRNNWAVVKPKRFQTIFKTRAYSNTYESFKKGLTRTNEKSTNSLLQILLIRKGSDAIPKPIKQITPSNIHTALESKNNLGQEKQFL